MTSEEKIAVLRNAYLAYHLSDRIANHMITVSDLLDVMERMFLGAEAKPCD